MKESAMSDGRAVEYCACIYQAHCRPGKAGLCKLREGGTVNAGGGVCRPVSVTYDRVSLPVFRREDGQEITEINDGWHARWIETVVRARDAEAKRDSYWQALVDIAGLENWQNRAAGDIARAALGADADGIGR